MASGNETDEENLDAGRSQSQGNGEGNKVGDYITVVFKVDLHCEGCAMKLKRSVKGFEGVEAVAVDFSGGELKVVGMVDPSDLQERVESKTGKKVVLISPSFPQNKPPAKDYVHEKVDDSKQKAPPSSTVLKIRLHCRGCVQRIRRCITKINGVEAVSFDWSEDLVTVSGSLDGESLSDFLRRKLRRRVEIAPANKDEQGNSAEKDDEKNDDEYAGCFSGKQLYGDGFDLVQPPLLFSDENPNACSVM